MGMLIPTPKAKPTGSHSEIPTHLPRHSRSPRRLAKQTGSQIQKHLPMPKAILTLKRTENRTLKRKANRTLKRRD